MNCYQNDKAETGQIARSIPIIYFRVFCVCFFFRTRQCSRIQCVIATKDEIDANNRPIPNRFTTFMTCSLQSQSKFSLSLSLARWNAIVSENWSPFRCGPFPNISLLCQPIDLTASLVVVKRTLMGIYQEIEMGK